MSAAVDSSVLWAIFKQEAAGPAWMEKLVTLRSEGPLVACEAVWAETRPAFATAQEHTKALTQLGVTYDPLSAETAALAGELFANYRKAGGTRERLLADFLIAAHAIAQTKQLATIDAGFFRRHFRNLKLVSLPPVATDSPA